MPDGELPSGDEEPPPPRPLPRDASAGSYSYASSSNIGREVSGASALSGFSDEYEYEDDSDYMESAEDSSKKMKVSGIGYLEASPSSHMRKPHKISGREVSELSMISDGGYRIREMPELELTMQMAIKSVSDLLFVPNNAAQVLLRKFKWDEKTLIDKYFGREDSILGECGLSARCGGAQNGVEKNSSQNGAKKACSICFDDELEPKDVYSMSCDHEYCRECWYGFLTEAVSRGPVCVYTTCPATKCAEVVTEVEIGELASDLLPKFKSYQLRSFIDSNWLMRWCPGPACGRVAVASSVGLSGEGHCICGMMFCLRCGDPAHSPSTCEMLVTWKEKCEDESETTNWILTNTKKCPKCHVRIEKNQGCNHMTCRHCQYHFCWMCMRDWNVHGYNGSCNKYDIDEAKKDDWKKNKAQMELDRYIHYYNRFQAHSKGHEFAEDHLRTFIKRLEEEGGVADGLTVSRSDNSDFRAALEQLVECRRVLKNTYIVAYLMEKWDHRELFENHQAQLERFTEKLSELSEKRATNDDEHVEIVNLTRVVHTYVKHILELEDIE